MQSFFDATAINALVSSGACLVRWWKKPRHRRLRFQKELEINGVGYR
jgi:hypothetical protein